MSYMRLKRRGPHRARKGPNPSPRAYAERQRTRDCPSPRAVRVPGPPSPRVVIMVTLDSIRAARERIRSRIYESPCAYSQALSQLTGNQLWLKLENLQMTGSFKERGALNRIL